MGMGEEGGSDGWRKGCMCTFGGSGKKTVMGEKGGERGSQDKTERKKHTKKK